MHQPPSSTAIISELMLLTHVKIYRRRQGRVTGMATAGCASIHRRFGLSGWTTLLQGPSSRRLSDSSPLNPVTCPVGRLCLVPVFLATCTRRGRFSRCACDWQQQLRHSPAHVALPDARCWAGSGYFAVFPGSDVRFPPSLRHMARAHRRVSARCAGALQQ
jgi:hypothetical protein